MERQYRRSFLGPVWLTLNTLIFILAFSFFGALIFKTTMRDFLPYFAVGLVAFNFLTSTVSEGCDTFVAAENYIKHAAISKFGFCIRVVWRNLIYFLHSVVIAFGVLWFFDLIGQANFVSLLRGILLAVAWLLPLSFILGSLGARFRDVPLLVRSVLQTLFFVTPVFWREDVITEKIRWVLLINPFYLFTEAIRAPLLGVEVASGVVSSAGYLILLTICIFIITFRLTRAKIALWL